MPEETDLFDRPETALADLLEFLGEENNQAVVDNFGRQPPRLKLPFADAREALPRFLSIAPLAGGVVK